MESKHLLEMNVNAGKMPKALATNTRLVGVKPI